MSCDAPTLARDAKLLREAGYQLLSAHPLDLFPQTAHFEVVAAFAKADGREATNALKVFRQVERPSLDS